MRTAGSRMKSRQFAVEVGGGGIRRLKAPVRRWEARSIVAAKCSNDESRWTSKDGLGSHANNHRGVNLLSGGYDYLKVWREVEPRRHGNVVE
jgi:hypothetical protein